MTHQQLTPPPIAEPATDEEVAGAYAAAYAHGDLDALRAVLAPDAVFRLLMPGDFHTVHGSAAFVEQVAHAMSQADRWRPHSNTVAPIGDRFAARIRFVIEVGLERFHLEHQEVVSVRNGRVEAIDSVCSGFRPVATDHSAVGR